MLLAPGLGLRLGDQVLDSPQLPGGVCHCCPHFRTQKLTKELKLTEPKKEKAELSMNLCLADSFYSSIDQYAELRRTFFSSNWLLTGFDHGGHVNSSNFYLKNRFIQPYPKSFFFVRNPMIQSLCLVSDEKKGSEQ